MDSRTLLLSEFMNRRTVLYVTAWFLNTHSFACVCVCALIHSGPPPGDLPDPGIEPGSPALQADSLPLSHREAPSLTHVC